MDCVVCLLWWLVKFKKDGRLDSHGTGYSLVANSADCDRRCSVGLPDRSCVSQAPIRQNPARNCCQFLNLLSQTGAIGHTKGAVRQRGSSSFGFALVGKDQPFHPR